MTISRVLFMVLVASPLLRADVLVVDAGGGGDFTTLTAAVAAAVNGDTILVRDGEYLEAGPVIVDGKGLTIAGEPFDPVMELPAVTVRPGLLVRNLTPGKLVVLENLRLVGADSTATAAASAGLKLNNNNSHVRVQACTLVGGSGNHNTNPDGAPGVNVESTLSSAMTGCHLVGGDGQFSPDLGVLAGDAGPGLSLNVGQVHLSHSLSWGGYGGSNIVGGWPQGGVGGAGVSHAAGTLFFVSTGLSGGLGGTAHHGGAGGNGLQLGPAGFAWFMAGSFANGGSGGSSDEGPDGADGIDIVDPADLVSDFGGSEHGFDVTSPLREGQGGLLTLDGDPSDATLLFASLSPHQLGMPGKQGVFMLFPTALIGPFIFGLGSAELPFTAPALPASLEALNVHLQPLYAGTGTHGIVIGPGRVLTLLDASF